MLGSTMGLSRTGRNWRKFLQKRTTGMPPKSSANPRSLHSYWFTRYSVCAPNMMLTSSTTSMSFSCRSIFSWPSTYTPVARENAALLASFEPAAAREASFENLHAEWIVIPSMVAAAAPEVAVSKSR